MKSFASADNIDMGFIIEQVAFRAFINPETGFYFKI